MFSCFLFSLNIQLLRLYKSLKLPNIFVNLPCEVVRMTTSLFAMKTVTFRRILRLFFRILWYSCVCLPVCPLSFHPLAISYHSNIQTHINNVFFVVFLFLRILWYSPVCLRVCPLSFHLWRKTYNMSRKSLIRFVSIQKKYPSTHVCLAGFTVKHEVFPKSQLRRLFLAL